MTDVLGPIELLILEYPETPGERRAHRPWLSSPSGESTGSPPHGPLSLVRDPADST